MVPSDNNNQFFPSSVYGKPQDVRSQPVNTHQLLATNLLFAQNAQLYIFAKYFATCFNMHPTGQAWPHSNAIPMIINCCF